MDQTFDKMFFDSCKNLAGVDEVGVTALAGPIVASCVVLPRLSYQDDLSLYLIDDSKKIREKYRTQAYDIIRNQAISIGIGVVPPKEVDALDIFVASNLAMRRAIRHCISNSEFYNTFQDQIPDFFIIDGNREINLGDLKYKLIPKGDLKSLSIAAASIVAKVHRDDIMRGYDKIYPGYSFSSNKGYKCEAHFQGMDEGGIIPDLHRTSMYPIAKKKNESKEVSIRRRKWIQVSEEKFFKEG